MGPYSQGPNSYRWTLRRRLRRILLTGMDSELCQLKWGVTKLNGSLPFDTAHGATVRITVPNPAEKAKRG